jgi:hypothetical protein
LKALFKCLALLPILALPMAADSDEQQKSVWELNRERFQDISKTRPRRLDEPLREDNISDEEVREIEAATIELFPGALVNISGVTAGCPCQDGPACDSQVWVVAYRDDKSFGLLLSRIEGHWVIGPVQRWWRQYEKLERKMSAALKSGQPNRFERYRKLQQAQNDMQENFPLCH